MSDVKDMNEVPETREPITTVRIADDVVSVIASMAASEVEGVNGMTGSFAGDLVEKLGKKNLSKGIKVDVTETSVSISLSLLVEYGHKLQEVAKNVQRAVKNTVEAMTGLTVSEVNIMIQGIVFPQPEDGTEEDASAAE
ncbi:MAG: Asp23/Gls24 family envelope stress response protein [Bacillota bacterium]|nr:Asp23/Gls24 family envelope stress response protein [Bacillota bacterium]